MPQRQELEVNGLAPIHLEKPLEGRFGEEITIQKQLWSSYHSFSGTPQHRLPEYIYRLQRKR